MLVYQRVTSEGFMIFFRLPRIGTIEWGAIHLRHKNWRLWTDPVFFFYWERRDKTGAFFSRFHWVVTPKITGYTMAYLGVIKHSTWKSPKKTWFYWENNLSMGGFPASHVWWPRGYIILTSKEYLVFFSLPARWGSLDFIRVAFSFPPSSSSFCFFSSGTAGPQLRAQSHWDLALAVEVRQWPCQRDCQIEC